MGICHSLSSLWWGCAPTCFTFPACQVVGCSQLSCPHHSTRHRWCHGCMWPALTPADDFAMHWLLGHRLQGEVCVWLL